jgi:hypothetical protein
LVFIELANQFPGFITEIAISKPIFGWKIWRERPLVITTRKYIWNDNIKIDVR